ncbi:unnamed protein product [Prunus armeniaca]|uniref:Uncharacterized protein n=1 Tax=Prunus armeniaca TaxID=36596 RepID=A0A6J5Y861_PRUAR|nr:unnamed protein product [Prunus armeniaca]
MGKGGIWGEKGKLDGKPKEDESKEKEDDSVEVEYKMWRAARLKRRNSCWRGNKSRNPLKRKWTQRLGVVRTGWDQINGVLQLKALMMADSLHQSSNNNRRRRSLYSASLEVYSRRIAQATRRRGDQFWPDLCPTSKQAGRFTGILSCA